MEKWNETQEAAFTQIMKAGLERLPAIRLYKRCKSNLAKALTIAQTYAAGKSKSGGTV